MSAKRKGDWMQTYTGRQFWPLDPRPEEVDIVDIAKALSQQCRFAGHTTEFYSVAQHSVLVSRRAGELVLGQPRLRREAARSGLLHDAAEAYLVDLPRPVKNQPGFELYRLAEIRLMRAIRERFGVYETPAQVRWADDQVLMTEARDLLGPKPCPWACDAEPLPDIIRPLPPAEAHSLFMRAFEELFGGGR